MGQDARPLRRGEPAPEDRLHALRREGWLDDQKIQVLAHIAPSRRLAAPPGSHRGQGQALAQQAAAEAGKKGNKRRGFHQPAAQGIGNRYVAGADRFDQAGHSKIGVGAQLEGIAKAIVHAPQNHVHRPEPFERLEKDAVLAHRQVAALDQGEAEIAGQIGMLEVGLVQRSGGEQHYARMGARRRGKAQQGFAKGAEKRSQPVHLGFAKEVGKSLRHDDAVFQRIAGAGRGLGAVGDHPPLAIGRARQIDGEQVQVGRPGTATLWQARQKAGLPNTSADGRSPFSSSFWGP